MFQALGEPILDNFFEIRIDSEPWRNCKVRKRIVDGLEVQVAARGDLSGPCQQLRIIAENSGHFIVRLEVELVGVELHPIRIVD